MPIVAAHAVPDVQMLSSWFIFGVTVVWWNVGLLHGFASHMHSAFVDIET